LHKDSIKERYYKYLELNDKIFVDTRHVLMDANIGDELDHLANIFTVLILEDILFSEINLVIKYIKSNKTEENKIKIESILHRLYSIVEKYDI